MKWEKENFYLSQEYLSNIELYFSDDIADSYIQMSEEESRHISKVMRHSVGEELFVTDGKGTIYKTSIIEACSSTVTLRITERIQYTNEFENIIFCLPRLKSNDRFEFALEKCIELGITNFIIFNSERTIAKGEKIERWNKIALAAMKQSLRSFLPNIQFAESLDKLNEFDGKKYIFDQNAEIKLVDMLADSSVAEDERECFIFGPEGGLSDKEIAGINNFELISLTPNRLRSETAIVTAASFLSLSKSKIQIGF